MAIAIFVGVYHFHVMNKFLRSMKGAVIGIAQVKDSSSAFTGRYLTHELARSKPNLDYKIGTQL